MNIYVEWKYMFIDGNPMNNQKNRDKHNNTHVYARYSGQKLNKISMCYFY